MSVDQVTTNIFPDIVKAILSGWEVVVYYEGQRCVCYLSPHLGFAIRNQRQCLGSLTPAICESMDGSTTEVNGQTYLTAELIELLAAPRRLNSTDELVELLVDIEPLQYIPT